MDPLLDIRRLMTFAGVRPGSAGPAPLARSGSVWNRGRQRAVFPARNARGSAANASSWPMSGRPN